MIMTCPVCGAKCERDLFSVAGQLLCGGSWFVIRGVPSPVTDVAEHRPAVML